MTGISKNIQKIRTRNLFFDALWMHGPDVSSRLREKISGIS
ncbi:hypothetical protein RRSWK_06640 [Rhodopirellula sp. SWK7]|nr:hypothetical protein RRSWK_06640 [Rhodopirellula sp. SWK7]